MKLWICHFGASAPPAMKLLVRISCGLLVLVLVLAVCVCVAGCRLFTPLPAKSTLAERLAAFPSGRLPVSRPVALYWDDHAVPYVVAEADSDLAFALGLVHAHLRLGQMEMMRRISQGRLAEMLGPPMAKVDEALRMLDFGRAAPKIEAGMPDETRRWIEEYVRGINYYAAHVERLPAEFRVLNLKVEPWTTRDVVTLGRMLGADVNWIVFFQMTQLRGEAHWREFWDRMNRLGEGAPTSFEPNGSETRLYNLLNGSSKSGSNCLVFSPKVTGTGAGMIASDPHLGLSIPNIWVVCGMKSPRHHAVGLMFPGVPIVALGRNPWIAWGGTNMRAASSDLVDVSGQPADSFESRREKIGVRWWFDRTITVRESRWGPVMTDASVFDRWTGPPLALRWVGHEASDEFTAFLKADGARSWKEFREAWKTYAVSGQNMLCVDREGNIGQVLAVRMPVRGTDLPKDVFVRPEQGAGFWMGRLGALDLPSDVNPPSGFIVSCNNAPVRTQPPLGYFFSGKERVERFHELLDGKTGLGLADLETIQQDVYSTAGVRTRDNLVRIAGEPGPGASPERKALLAALTGWDGRYTTDSRGALAFQLVLYHFIEGYYGRRYGQRLADALTHSDYVFGFMDEDFRSEKPDVMKRAVDAAIARAEGEFGGFADWGDFHRLRLSHMLGRLPFVGKRYRFMDLPAAGSSTTINKTSHTFTNRRHPTGYGSCARHISDMSDPDRNYFVLLGGQDGWLNSANMLDQVPIWMRGGYIQVPLRPETVERTFGHRIRLVPDGTVREANASGAPE